MRTIFAILYTCLTAALAVCSNKARRSGKLLGPNIGLIDAALIPPLLGNLLIISTSDPVVADIGRYIYFVGMDLVMYAILRFAHEYCGLPPMRRILRVIIYTLLIADAVQLLLNPFFHHAFGTEPILAAGKTYWQLVPYAGQTFHRVLDYSVFLAVLCIFAVKIIRTPRIYSERYSVIFAVMVVTGLWQTVYIFLRIPVDRSMIGFALFGLLAFYFSLYYEPVRLMRRMLAGIASELSDAAYFFDAAGTCVWANTAGADLVGLEGDLSSAGWKLRERFGSLPSYTDSDGDWCASRSCGTGEETRFYVLSKTTTTDQRDGAVGAFLTVRDNTEEEKALRMEQYKARHDPLTGLYNREHLTRVIRSRLDREPDAGHYIVFLNVHDFKLVNDVFGHEFGDYCLCRVADHLREVARPTSIFGRLQGDTFGMLTRKEGFDAEQAERDLSNFRISDGKVEHTILIHLGIYEVTEPDLDVSLMFDRARMALTTIRQDYKRHLAYYDSTMRENVLWNQRISGELHGAIERRELIPYLQPMVDGAGRTVGAEALVRWQHPEEGLLTPGRFIPVFEQNGMIAEVDRYMWRCACEILQRWQEQGRDWFLSVNISPKDFYYMDVAEEIRSVVAEFGINPSKLRLEITETVLMSDIENRLRLIDRLKSMGFLVEMDDFGSGYSSLNMLKDIPVDLIKIDMAFLDHAKDDKAEKILRNMIRLSDELGISSLTEGVETRVQYKMLTDMGCKLFQGYFFSRPIPLEEFEETAVA